MSEEPHTYSLSELFARDPRQLTKEDVKIIVTELRAAREKFVAGDLSAGNPKRLTGAAKEIADIKLDKEIKL